LAAGLYRIHSATEDIVARATVSGGTRVMRVSVKRTRQGPGVGKQQPQVSSAEGPDLSVKVRETRVGLRLARAVDRHPAATPLFGWYLTEIAHKRDRGTPVRPRVGVEIVFGHVAAILRGGRKLPFLINRAELRGFAATPIAVPVVDVALLGEYLAPSSVTPKRFVKPRCFKPRDARPAGPEEIVKAGIARRFHWQAREYATGLEPATTHALALVTFSALLRIGGTPSRTAGAYNDSR